MSNSKFEVLCVTTKQHDFSKIEEMNLHSNVVFANQSDFTAYEECIIDDKHIAKMISTKTRGVGINRNIAMMYASGDICIFADDDIIYVDNLEQIVLSEFEKHPDADVFIFNIDTDSEERKQKYYSKTRKWHHYEPMPWGAVRVAFRLSSVQKSNVWFSTLYGGGTIFPSGEDSIWLNDIKSKNTIYVSQYCIGTIKMDESSWFTGYDEKFYYAKGAFYANSHRNSFLIFALYCAFRTKNRCKVSFGQSLKWIFNGKQGYSLMLSYDEYKEKYYG